MSGLTAGGVFVLVPLYVAEISDDKIRGKLGSYFILAINFGTLAAFVAGNYLDYYLFAYLMLIFPIVFLTVFLLLPETPQYLVVKGKSREAEKSLYFLRGCNEITPIPSEVKEELYRIRRCNISSTNSTVTDDRESGLWQLISKTSSVIKI